MARRHMCSGQHLGPGRKALRRLIGFWDIEMWNRASFDLLTTARDLETPLLVETVEQRLLHRADAVLHRCLQLLLFEPEQADSQLP